MAKKTTDGLIALLNRPWPGPQASQAERGQMLLILAFAMMGLLAAAGLALDAGYLFVRRAQLDRATDAAALAGVVTMYTNNYSVSIANDTALEIYALNGIDFTDGTVQTNAVVDTNTAPTSTCETLPGSSVWRPSRTADGANDIDVCGRRNRGAVPGAERYFVRAQWRTQLFFMPIFGFNNVPLYSDAEAEYYPVLDMYASGTQATGILKTSNQAIFGPQLCTQFGDPYTPWNGYGGNSATQWDQTRGRYNYRILVPETYYNERNDGAGESPIVRVEIFDPDGANRPTGNYTIYGQQGTPQAANYTNRKQPEVRQITGAALDGNPFWFHAVEENRGTANNGQCGEPANYTEAYNTRIVFRLYYYRQTATGALEQVDIGYYAPDPNNLSTDLHWVSPTNDATHRMPDLVTILNNRGITVDLNLSAANPAQPGTWYRPTGSPIICTSDANGDGILHDPALPNTDRNSNDVRCVLADGNGDGAINASDGEPVATPANCATYTNATTSGLFGTPGAHGTAVGPFNPDGTGCASGANNFDFIVNLETETPDIYVDPGTRARYLYVHVIGAAGKSENGFELWAGPPRAESEVPANVNARNMYVVNNRELVDVNPNISEGMLHDSAGIGMFSIGRLPMNSNTGNPVDIPLTYIDGQFEGTTVTIGLHDPDAGASGPIYFFFDSVPKDDYLMCFGSNLAECQSSASRFNDLLNVNNVTYLGQDNIPNAANAVGTSGWTYYDLIMPTDQDDNFYGGAMIANYAAGNSDTYGWNIQIESRPYLTN